MQEHLTHYEEEKLPFRGRGLDTFTMKVGNPCSYIESAKDRPVRILEIGCGFGQLLVDMALKYKNNVALYGINKPGSDVDVKTAIKIAKHKGSVPLDFNLEDQAIQFLSWDADCPLPFSDHSFDLILSQVCIAYISDKLSLLTEVCRILKPLGTALLHVEFEHGSESSPTTDDWHTLTIQNGSESVDLASFFNNYPSFEYHKKGSGSILKITGGVTPTFNTLLVDTIELTNPDQHGKRSIYKIIS